MLSLLNQRRILKKLKGSVSPDYPPLFFLWSEPTWAPDKQAKVFSNLVSISPRFSITKLCCTLLRSSPRYVAHHGDHFCDVQYCTQRRFFRNLEPLTPRYDGHRGDYLSCVLHTAKIISAVCTEIISAVGNTPLRSSLRYVAHRGDFFEIWCPWPKLCGVLHIAEIVSAVWDNFMIEYLGEIETELENNLACLSGTQMGSNHERNGGRKSRDTLPLRMPMKRQMGYFIEINHDV